MDGCANEKSESKIDRIFSEINHLAEISQRIRGKSYDIHDSLLGGVAEKEASKDEVPSVGKLEVIIHRLCVIRGVLTGADGLLTSVSNQVAK